MAATKTKRKPKPRPAPAAEHSARNTAAAPAAPPSEAALYVPDPDVMEVAGRRLRVGKMRIGASLRFTEWASKFIARGSTAVETLRGITDEAAKAQAMAGLSVLTLLPEDDVAELVAIALSNDEQVDRAWVADHWDLEWVLPLLARFTEVNPLGRYFVPLGKVFANLVAQMPTATPPNGTTRSR